MTWKMRWVGILIKKNHLFRTKTMKTNKHDNPTNIHEVNHDFVCPKENFEINLKMFHSDALYAHNGFEISKDASYHKSDAPSVSSVFKCEFDNWSPNESMR
jgi:hypothetical protein